jgi:hypothetical protein
METARSPHKPCTRCGKSEPDVEFYPGRSSWCAQCHRDRGNTRRADKKAVLKKAEADRRARLLAAGKCFNHPSENSVINGKCETCRIRHNKASRARQFGLTEQEYDSWMQRGACEACQDTADLGLDHCHTTDAIRGVLCGNCNRALGLLKDSPERIDALATYIRRTWNSQAFPSSPPVRDLRKSHKRSA